MQILGVDFGLKKIGLALAEEKGLAYPLGVVQFSDEKDAIKEIVRIIKQEDVSMVVFGLSEGIMEKKTISFAENLKKIINVKIDYQDETLTTREAQRLSIEAGIKQKKRRQMEDAYAATLLLQEYLENN